MMRKGLYYNYTDYPNYYYDGGGMTYSPDGTGFIRGNYNTNWTPQGITPNNAVFSDYQQKMVNEANKKQLAANNSGSGGGAPWGAIAGAAGTNIANALLDTEAPVADRVAGALGIPALASIWKADTAKGDAALSNAQNQLASYSKNNFIQDASSSLGSANAIKLNNTKPITAPISMPSNLSWRDFKGNMFMKGLAANAQGAAAGSVGGPWGALGGAVTGLLGSLFGGIGAKKRAKAAHADWQAKMGTVRSAMEGQYNKQVLDQTLSNMQALANGNIQQRISDMSNIRAFGGNLFDGGGDVEFKSELDWSPESWFSKRVAKPDGTYYNEDEAKRLASHVPEYNQIERDAKANGTWLKMPDGSTWTGDPRSWVMLQSKALRENYGFKPWYTGQAEWPTTFDYPNDNEKAIETNKVTRAPYYDGQMWFSDNKGYGDAFAYYYASNGDKKRKNVDGERDLWGHNFLAVMPKKGKYISLAAPDGTGDHWKFMPYDVVDGKIERLPDSEIDSYNDIETNKKTNRRKDGKTVLTDDVVNWSKDLGDDATFLHNVNDGLGIYSPSNNIEDVIYRYNHNLPVRMDELKIKTPILNEVITQPDFTKKVKFIEGNTGDFDINNPYKYSLNNGSTSNYNNIAAYGGNLFDDGGGLTDEQQMVMADIQNDPRILFTPKYTPWRDYIRRESPDYLDRLYTSLPYEQQQDIYQNDREAWGALSNKVKGDFGAAGVRKATDKWGEAIANAELLAGGLPAMEALSLFPTASKIVNTGFGFLGAANAPVALRNTIDYAKKGDWSRAGFSAGETALNTALMALPFKSLLSPMGNYRLFASPYVKAYGKLRGYPREPSFTDTRFYTEKPIPDDVKLNFMNNVNERYYNILYKYTDPVKKGMKMFEDVPSLAAAYEKQLNKISNPDFIKGLADGNYYEYTPVQADLRGGSSGTATYFYDEDVITANKEFGGIRRNGPHEARHRMQNYIEPRRTDRTLKGAFNDRFYEALYEKYGLDNIDASYEVEATLLDTRNELIGKRMWEEPISLKEQNTIITTKTDDEILEALSHSNGYGQAYVKKLKKHPEELKSAIEYLRDALRYAPVATTPIIGKALIDNNNNNTEYAMGGHLYTDLSPNMMNLWNNKQQIDQQKIMNQQMNFGLGNSFNQNNPTYKKNLFLWGGNSEGRNPKEPPEDDVFESKDSFLDNLSNAVSLGSNYIQNRMFGNDYNTVPGDTIRYKDNLFTIDGSTDVTNSTFGFRNRGNYNEINASEAPITSINKFVPYDKKYTKGNYKTKTYMGISKNGKLKVGSIDKFEEGDIITTTTSNYIKDFKTDSNGNNVYKQDNNGNSSRNRPVTITKGENGDIEGSLAILTGKRGEENMNNKYGDNAGGRILVTDDNGHYSVLAGSPESVIKQFRNFKKKYNLEYVHTINLDNGTFGKGLYTSDKKFTEKTLKDYDKLNTGGGNFLYLKKDNEISVGNYQEKINDDTYKYKYDGPSPYIDLYGVPSPYVNNSWEKTNDGTYTNKYGDTYNYNQEQKLDPKLKLPTDINIDFSNWGLGKPEGMSERQYGYDSLSYHFNNDREKIREFQKEYNKTHNDKIKEDGIVGNETVRAYQIYLNEQNPENNIIIDGIYGDKTHEAALKSKEFAYGGNLNPVDPPKEEPNTTAVYSATPNIDSSYINNQLSPYQKAVLDGTSPLDYVTNSTREAIANQKAKTTSDINTAVNMMYGDRYGEADYNNRYDNGGQLNTSDLPDNMQYYANGGTHEENPYGGIQVGVDQQGTPNLTEQGEFRYGNFIFSDRINVDPEVLSSFNLSPYTKRQNKKAAKGKLSYADMAKKYAKKNKELMDDPITKNSVDAFMQRAANAQEYQKTKEAKEAALAQEMNDYKTALNKQYNNPTYGNMKYNGMGNAATQQGVNAGVDAGMGNPMSNADLSNVNRSGNAMMAAYGGNLYWGGGWPIFRRRKPQVTHSVRTLGGQPRQETLPGSYFDAYGAHNYTDRIPIERADLDGKPVYYNMPPRSDDEYLNTLDNTGRQQLLDKLGYDVGGVGTAWGKKSKSAWDIAMLARQGRNADGALATEDLYSPNRTLLYRYKGNPAYVNNGTSTIYRPAYDDGSIDVDYSYGPANGNTSSKRETLLDYGNTGTINTGTGTNNNTTDTDTTGNTLDGTYAKSYIKGDPKDYPLYNTSGLWAQAGKGITPLIYDWANKTNVKYDPDNSGANRLEALAATGPVLRTADTIGGYRAPNLMDVERQNNAATAQGLAQLQGMFNVANGNRGFVGAQSAQNSYNTGMSIGNNYMTAQQYNDANRLETDKFNNTIDVANQNARNSMYQDNQKYGESQIQRAVDGLQKAEALRQYERLYADRVNDDRMSNRASNMAAYTDNLLNFIHDRANENKLLNAKNADITNPYYTDRDGRVHYAGDSGLYSFVDEEFAKNKVGDKTLKNGHFTGDELTEFNDLQKTYSAKDLANKPELREMITSLVNREVAKRQKEYDDDQTNIAQGYEDNFNRYQDLLGTASAMQSYGDGYFDKNTYDFYANKYAGKSFDQLTDAEKRALAQNINSLDSWIVRSQNAYYNRPRTNTNAYGGPIRRKNKKSKNEPYSYMSIS